MKECGDVVIVAEDLKSNSITACVTLVLERRFNRKLEYRLRFLDFITEDRKSVV